MLKILIITFILVGIAFAGLGIRLLLDRKSEFSGEAVNPDPRPWRIKGFLADVAEVIVQLILNLFLEPLYAKPKTRSGP